MHLVALFCFINAETDQRATVMLYFWNAIPLPIILLCSNYLKCYFPLKVLYVCDEWYYDISSRIWTIDIIKCGCCAEQLSVVDLFLFIINPRHWTTLWVGRRGTCFDDNRPVLPFFPFYSLPDVLCDPIDLFWRKGTSFQAMTARTAPSSDGLLAEVFCDFPRL